MNTVEIKIVINGKEAIATLQLTDENVQKVAERLNVLGQKGTNSIELLRQRAAMLTQLLENAELGSPQFEELSRMANGAYKELSAAEMALNKTTGTSGSARMALTSFSQGLSDATMFQQDFRVGLMSVRNNIEQFVMQLGQASAAAKASGVSLKTHLVGALSGAGGVMIGLTAAMALLQILPGLLESNDKKVEEFSIETIQGANNLTEYAQAIANVEKEFKELSVDEIKDKFIEIDNQIQLSRQRSTENIQSWTGELKAFLNQRYGTSFDVTGGEGERAAMLEKSRKMGEEELANRSRVKVLEDEISDLREAQNKKGSDAKAIADEIEVKERERSNLIKSTTERTKEQAEIILRMQKANVDAMAEGDAKARASAQARFDEAKTKLKEELDTDKISRDQYRNLLRAEEKKLSNDLAKIEQEKNTFAVETRAAALKRMSEMENSEVLSRINLDEKIALSKAQTEQERLEITRDFAIKRVEAEANAQAQILLIERQALESKFQTASPKEAEKIKVDLKANEDALNKILSDVNQKKAEIQVDFKVQSGQLPDINSIAGVEAEISRLQQEYSRETNEAKKRDILSLVDLHKQSLLAMTYSEKQFAQDVYGGAKNLLGQLQQLWSQQAQQEADAKLQQTEEKKNADLTEIEDQKQKSLDKITRERDEALASAQTQQQKNAINKKFAEEKAKLDKESDAKKAAIEKEAAAREKEIKIEAFEAQKSISRTNAMISSAEAIVKTMASVPFPANIPLAALQAAAGLIQLKVIDDAKPALAGGGLFEGDGKVEGPGGPKDDQVNAKLSNGEYVVNAESASKNLPLLEALNNNPAVYENRLNVLSNGIKNLLVADNEQSITVEQLKTFLLNRVDGAQDSANSRFVKLEDKFQYIYENLLRMPDNIYLAGSKITGGIIRQSPGFAEGGLFGDQSSAVPAGERLSFVKLPNLSVDAKAMTFTIDNKSEVDFTQLEKKMDKLIEVVETQPIVLQVDDQVITEVVERRQLLNSMRKF